MLRTVLMVSLVVALPCRSPVHAKEGPDEALWTAARKGNAAKVARILEGDVSPEGRVVALSVSASNNQPEAFIVLWTHDNSDVAPAALDHALCYAHRHSPPAAEIAEVLQSRALTIEACCNGNPKQPYCAGRPIRLTSQEYPPAQVATIFVDSAEVPEGATKIAVLWDQKISVLDPTGSAKYGTPKISPAGSKDWAMKFAAVLGQLGADAILISSAETIEAAESAMVRFPGGSFSGFKYGAVLDRIEIVGIRTGRE